LLKGGVQLAKNTSEVLNITYLRIFSLIFDEEVPKVLKVPGLWEEVLP